VNEIFEATTRAATIEDLFHFVFFFTIDDIRRRWRIRARNGWIGSHIRFE
jgi:hypothetical protein